MRYNKFQGGATLSLTFQIVLDYLFVRLEFSYARRTDCVKHLVSEGLYARTDLPELILSAHQYVNSTNPLKVLVPDFDYIGISLFVNEFILQRCLYFTSSPPFQAIQIQHPDVHIPKTQQTRTEEKTKDRRRGRGSDSQKGATWGSEQPHQ